MRACQLLLSIRATGSFRQGCWTQNESWSQVSASIDDTFHSSGEFLIMVKGSKGYIMISFSNLHIYHDFLLETLSDSS